MWRMRSADVEPPRQRDFPFAREVPSVDAPREQRREGLLLRADLLPERLGEHPARQSPADSSLAVLAGAPAYSFGANLGWTSRVHHSTGARQTSRPSKSRGGKLIIYHGGSDAPRCARRLHRDLVSEHGSGFRRRLRTALRRARHWDIAVAGRGRNLLTSVSAYGQARTPPTACRGD
jgi:hypothetical protein